MTDKTAFKSGRETRLKPNKRQPLAILRVMLGSAVVLLAGVFIVSLAFNHVPESRMILAENNIASSTLNQLALSENAHNVDQGKYSADLNDLLQYGFWPPENVRLKMIILDIRWNGGRTNGFAAWAGSAKGDTVLACDSFSGAAVRKLSAAEPLGQEYEISKAMMKEQKPSGPGKSLPPVLFFQADFSAL